MRRKFPQGNPAGGVVEMPRLWATQHLDASQPIRRQILYSFVQPHFSAFSCSYPTVCIDPAKQTSDGGAGGCPESCGWQGCIGDHARHGGTALGTTM